MKKAEFWLVELGVRMGPLVLGTEVESVLQILRDHRIDVDRFAFDGTRDLPVPEIGTHLIFSETSPRTLSRIDVTDERLRFASLAVIGKRAHEIIGIFKLSRKETLWCSIDADGTPSNLTPENDAASRSREQLARGTIWIPSFGLGLTLRDGLVSTVHLCDPAQSPRNGSGPWTKEQQRLSEVRELPATSTTPTQRKRMSVLVALLHLILVASLGTVIWRAIQLQRRWDAASEVPAVVVALDPPPPNVLPNNITVRFNDSHGIEHSQTLGHLQFLMTPKMGDEVNIRYLPDEPDTVLGPVASRDIGFETAIPYVFGIVAIYSFLQLILFGTSYRTRRIQ
ncbi:MAG: hypothetical protein ABL921_13730 [Pirellula sp.]